MSMITVVGSGYVGMANATMLAKYNTVTVLDIDKINALPLVILVYRNT